MAELLSRLPKPLAVLGCNDSAAGIASRFCVELSLRVPEDVAILGIDNDELRQCRIERGKLLLSQTDLSEKQVAVRCGFGSLTCFTTAFRDLTGESPARYRQQMRAKLIG